MYSLTMSESGSISISSNSSSSSSGSNGWLQLRRYPTVMSLSFDGCRLVASRLSRKQSMMMLTPLHPPPYPSAHTCCFALLILTFVVENCQSVCMSVCLSVCRFSRLTRQFQVSMINTLQLTYLLIKKYYLSFTKKTNVSSVI